MKKTLFLALVVLALAACAPVAQPPGTIPPDVPPEEPVFCTADVKECPDGSYVSRVQPDCDFAPCPPEGPVAPGETETAESCAAKGGSWQRRFVGFICNMPASDAGKPCTDSENCEGMCLVEMPADTEGACSEFKIVYGCVNPMENGRVTPMCID